MQQTRVLSLGQEDPLQEEMIPPQLQHFCLEKSHGQRSLVGCNPWGHKSWAQLSDYTTATHNIMACDPGEVSSLSRDTASSSIKRRMTVRTQ